MPFQTDLIFPLIYTIFNSLFSPTFSEQYIIGHRGIINAHIKKKTRLELLISWRLVVFEYGSLGKYYRLYLAVS